MDRKILVGNPTASPPAHERFFGGDRVVDPAGNIMPSLSPEEVTVATAGAMFTSVKAAVQYAAGLASVSNPMLVRVAPGVYVEDPFTIPTYVKVQGAGWATTVLAANDLANHFVELGAGAVFRDFLMLGPTGFGKACVHHSASDPRPSSVTEVVFGRGYYGILSEPLVSKGPMLVQLASFVFTGTAIQSLIRAEGYSDIIAAQCLAMGPDNQIVRGYSAVGPNASLTLVTCDFECGGVTDAVFVDGGAFALLKSCLLKHGGNAIHVGSNGAPVVIAHDTTIQNTPGFGFTKDILIDTAAATVHFSGSGTRTQMDNSVGADFSASGADVTPGSEGTMTLGEFRLGTDPTKMLPLGSYARACFLTGLVSGGEVTRNTGRVLNVAAGTGFVNDGTDPIAVAWGLTTVTITASKTEYVFIDATGTVQHSETQPDYALNIVLAQAVADATDIMLLTQDEIEIPHVASRSQEYYEDIIGPISTFGAVVSADATPLQVDITSGEFVIGLSERPVAGQTPAVFTLVHHGALGAWLYTPGQTTIDDTQYDSGAGLVPMTGGKYRKDCLYTVVNKGATEFFLVVGQQEFLAADVPNGPLPVPPDILQHYAMRTAGIAVLKSAGAIYAIFDVRPTIGQNAASSGGIAGDHDLLTHLDHDTHLQYLNTARALVWHGLLAGAHVTGGDSHAHVGGAGAQIDHTGLSNIGTKTHAALELQVNNHLADTANPHATTKAQVGLSSVLNVQQIPVTEKGFPGGVAALDAFSQISDPTVPVSIARVTALAAHTGNLSNPHATSASQVGLGSVTNDAQLKRSAGDFSSFSSKGTPVSADVLLIEDSAAGGAKKSIQIGNLPVPPVTTHGGSHTSIGGDPVPAVIPSGASGLMTGVDKAKLDGINPTAVPAGSVVPISDAGGKLDAWVSSNAAVATPSLRKLGAGATDAAAGNDGRLSDPRTPLAHAASHTTGADQIADAAAGVHGLMSAADKAKLTGIAAGAQVASVSGAAPISSTGGTTPAISISPATVGAAGSMSAADKAKLDGIAAGATNNVFGQNYQTATDVTRTTQGVGFANKLTLTTPPLTGTYRVGWKAVLDHSTTTSNAEAQLWNATAAAVVGVTQVFRPTNASERVLVGGAADIVFTGAAKTFNLRFQAATAGLAGCSDARLEFWKVGP